MWNHGLGRNVSGGQSNLHVYHRRILTAVKYRAVILASFVTTDVGDIGVELILMDDNALSH